MKGFIPLWYAICTNLIPPSMPFSCWLSDRWDLTLYLVLYTAVLAAAVSATGQCSLSLSEVLHELCSAGL